MELSKWKRRTLIPLWGDNDQEDEPCAIIFQPPSVGLMASWREITLMAPTVDEETFKDEDHRAKGAKWTQRVHDFRDTMIRDQVLAVDNLTKDGRQIDLDEAIAFILENEGLREEVFFGILGEGSVGRAQGKG